MKTLCVNNAFFTMLANKVASEFGDKNSKYRADKYWKEIQSLK